MTVKPDECYSHSFSCTGPSRYLTPALVQPPSRHAPRGSSTTAIGHAIRQRWGGTATTLNAGRAASDWLNGRTHSTTKSTTALTFTHTRLLQVKPPPHPPSLLSPTQQPVPGRAHVRQHLSPPSVMSPSRRICSPCLSLPTRHEPKTPNATPDHLWFPRLSPLTHLPQLQSLPTVHHHSVVHEQRRCKIKPSGRLPGS